MITIAFLRSQVRESDPSPHEYMQVIYSRFHLRLFIQVLKMLVHLWSGSVHFLTQLFLQKQQQQFLLAVSSSYC